MIARFSSIAALADAHGTETRYLSQHSGADETGITAAESLEMCRHGDGRLVSQVIPIACAGARPLRLKRHPWRYGYASPHHGS